MKGKVLVLASVASMIDQFNIPNIQILQDMGYEVHVACNFEKGNTCTQEKIENLKLRLKGINVKMYQIDFTRSVFNIKKDIISYKQVKKIVKINEYEFIHCHSPIGGVIGRLVSTKSNTICIYTAHGFHFFKGAPIINWVIFYPIEKLLSRYTDILIAINKEDHKIAKNKFKMRKLYYVPGVGIDIELFANYTSKRERLLTELSLEDDVVLLLSVGELSERKNHSLVIQCLPNLPKNMHYVIVGKGNKKQELLDIASSLNVDNRLHLLGFRTDVIEILKSSDLFIFPSLQEGLPVALMESIANNLPAVASDIRGNSDLIEETHYGTLFNLESEDVLLELTTAILHTLENKEKVKSKKSDAITKFSAPVINEIMREIYSLNSICKKGANR